MILSVVAEQVDAYTNRTAYDTLLDEPKVGRWNGCHVRCRSLPTEVSNSIKRLPFHSLTKVRKDLPQPKVG